MEVFIGNLSPRTTLSDLVNFFKGFAKDARIQIFDKRYEDGSASRYAVASFDSDKLAAKAIKKLHGQYLAGNLVVLREFLHRSYSNERRAMGWRDKPWHGVERRASERRRKQAAKPSNFESEMGIETSPVIEEIDIEDVRVEARDLFARKY